MTDTIKLWDVASGREVRTLTGHNGLSLVRGVQPRRRGCWLMRRLRLLHSRHEIKLWDISDLVGR
jgi:WD40 repeat protein